MANLVYTSGKCELRALRHRMMSRGMRSKVGTAATRALTELLVNGIMVGVGVVDWESGHAMTIYPNYDRATGAMTSVTWYYSPNQAADTAHDYRGRAQIRRVTHFPSDGAILTDGVC